MKASTKSTSLTAKSLVALVMLCASWTSSAVATPITYTFSASGPITGTLGAVPFGGASANSLITLTFVGDTSNVVPFLFPAALPVHGNEILIGTASVSITNQTTHTVVAQGTFSASDGIFVSIDNVNGGVGFGSAGVSPSSSSFPGQPAYPLGIFSIDPNIHTYDLQSSIVFSGLSDALSCVGFPGSCSTPVSLATTAGNLTLGAAGGTFDVLDNGTFTAVLGSTVVPEPTTIGLFAIGLIGLAGLGFAHRKAQI